jgi:hypothetical protein
MAALDELGRQLVDDALGAAIGQRRDALERRRDLGDPKAAWSCGHAETLLRGAVKPPRSHTGYVELDATRVSAFRRGVPPA